MKPIFILLLFLSVWGSNWAQKPKDFIITNEKDTIFGDNITAFRFLNNMGYFILKKKDESKLKIYYDKVYQLHKFNKKGGKEVTEIVQLDKSEPNSLRLLRPVIKSDKINLYYYDYNYGFDSPVVVSNIAYGHIYDRRTRSHFMELLKKCDAFKQRYRKEKRFKHKTEEKTIQMVQFYIDNCGD